MERVILAAGLSALLTCGARAQPASTTPTFEVASVKQNKSGTRGGSMEFSRGGERFTATNVPFGALVLLAYNLTVRQLSGPNAFFSEKYDVAAKAEHPVRPDEMLLMLQALLADRFKLVVHRDTREIPVYALTIGKKGPRLQPSDPSEGSAAVPRNPSHAGGTEPKSGHLIFKNESMPDFAWALSRMAGIGDRVVVDNTGLKGNYDFELIFGRYDLPPAAADTRPDAPEVFTALQEQLGLKLESKKAPVEFLVVDHVEPPTQN
jgi:uncharacterized protein (TIGR03435 family)